MKNGAVGGRGVVGGVGVGQSDDDGGGAVWGKPGAFPSAGRDLGRAVCGAGGLAEAVRWGKVGPQPVPAWSSTWDYPKRSSLLRGQLATGEGTRSTDQGAVCASDARPSQQLPAHLRLLRSPPCGLSTHRTAWHHFVGGHSGFKKRAPKR